MAIIKRYYVIQSKDGYFKPDNWSGGYPEFIDDFENCERYSSEELANKFLKSKYVAEQFKEGFKEARVRKITVTVE